MAQDPRIGLQPGFAGGVRYTGVLQQVIQPGQRPAVVRRAAVAVVAVVETQQAGAVDRQGFAACARSWRIGSMRK